MSWLAILKHAPVLLSAAEALLHRAKTSRADDHTRNVEARLVELAESSRASAELIQQMAAQLQALAMSQQNAARQLRIAISISVAATVIAVAAVVVAFVR
jgi:pantothenate kinase